MSVDHTQPSKAHRTPTMQLDMNHQQYPIEAVLFDLDGTLIDTAPDFIRIINQLSAQAGITPPTPDVIRMQVSEGARAMVHLMHPELTLEHPQLLSYRQDFLACYNDNIAVDTCLFDGMDLFLTQLEAAQIPWGIVTNKPRALSEKLLTALRLDTRCSVLVCPDDVKHTKPDPEPMLLAVDKINVNPQRTIYVGDHPRDILAGRAANMLTVLAAYGYLPPSSADDLAAWQADLIVQHISQLADRLTAKPMVTTDFI